MKTPQAMNGTIYYVGEFRFPEVAANSLRILGNAQALQQYGYDVLVIPGGRQAIPARAAKSHRRSYEGVTFLNIQSPNNLHRGKLARLVQFAMAGYRLARVLTCSITTRAEAVITTAGGGIRYFPFLKHLCRVRGVPLVCDLMEWYQGAHLPLGRYGPFSWENEFSMRHYIPRLGSIITISSFLQHYYAERGCSVIRIPPLTDCSAEKWSLRNNRGDSRRLALCFVGNAGKKDLVANAVRGLALLDGQVRQCQLSIIGPAKEELRKSLGQQADLLEQLRENLCFTGSLPHREALRHLEEADFSILLRPDLRFAHAGFPTKLVESLTMGVPVICNLTSDIGLYVHDAQEGFVVKDCSPEAFAEGLRRAIALSPAERRAMRVKARQRAETSFDYRNWVEPIGEFMRQVIGSRRQATL